MGKLEGKVAVVTGASKGIGAAIAKTLAAEGAAVVANYASSKSGADAVVSAITGKGGKAIAVKGDVSKTAALKAYGRLDILVNNAGVYEAAPLEDISEQHFHRLFDINVLGLLNTTKAAARHLHEGASIINISSLASRITSPNYAVYCATKGAVDAITGSLAKELGPRKIRVNAVNPGVVETEGTHSAGLVGGSDFEKAAVAQTPLGRVGQPQDIATVVAFFASDDAGWITGEHLFASGGF